MYMKVVASLVVTSAYICMPSLQNITHLQLAIARLRHMRTTCSFTTQEISMPMLGCIQRYNADWFITMTSPHTKDDCQIFIDLLAKISTRLTS